MRLIRGFRQILGMTIVVVSFFQNVYASEQPMVSGHRTLEVKGFQFFSMWQIRGRAESLQLSNFLSILDLIKLQSTSNRCGVEARTFQRTVQSFRFHIDNNRHPVCTHVTRWNKSIPIKIMSLFGWFFARLYSYTFES